MAFDASGLICLAGNTNHSLWAYATRDRREEVIRPGYLPDDRRRNFMLPGEVITVTCLPAPEGRRRARNPIAVFQATTARTMGGVWLLLPLSAIAWPEAAVSHYYATTQHGPGDGGEAIEAKA